MSDPWWPEGTDDPAFQTQRQAYGIIAGGDYVRARPGYTESAYLSPTVGTVTTPDPGPLPAQCVFVCKVRAVTAAPDQCIVAQYEGVPNNSWALHTSPNEPTLYWFTSVDGTALNMSTMSRPFTSGDEWHSLAISATTLTWAKSTDGVVWTQAATTPNAYPTRFDTSSVMRVGKGGGGIGTWQGRIYFVELRTGLDPAAGTVVWRFDSNEYPGTGTVYTDPRGRAWTLTSASALIPRTAPSTLTTLPQTALRYPTTFEGFDEVKNKAYLTVRWAGHSEASYEMPDGTRYTQPIGIAEIGWGWPITVKEEWDEVALTRSGFGYPATMNDGQTVFRAGRADFSTPETPAVISPSLGYAWSTPIQRIINNTQIAGCVSITSASHVQYLAAVWMPVTSGRSWVVYLDTDGSLKFQWSLDGTADGWAIPAILATKAELDALPKTSGDLVCIGVQFTKDNASPYVVAVTSADEGLTWTEGTRINVGGAPIADTFNASTSRLSIGARSDGVGNTQWEGNINWVEFRDLSQPLGSQVQWRFDAEDYPGTGTTWIDPRARTWTIASDTAMTEIIPATINVPPPIVYDKPLQPGQFYYYTLFFRTTRLDWIVGMTGSVLIPKNYHHDEHLWNTLPPFYRYTDANIRQDNGPLRKLLTVFGSELDLTREFVEQWQETYHIDKAPMALLKGVGANFGVPYRAGSGDVRYRAMLAALPLLLKQRGTVPALKHCIEAGTKWLCDINVGSNVMLLPDDSDFYTGTGSWGFLANATDLLDTDINTTGAALTYGSGFTGATTGRGTMRVYTTKATETTNLALVCGNGAHYTYTAVTDPTANWVLSDPVIPMYSGIPVEPGTSYGFTVQVAQQAAATAVNCYLLWYGAGGQPTDYLSKATGTNPVAASGQSWYNVVVQGTAPADAVYMTPVIYFTGRPASGGSNTSQWIDISGASAYVLDRAGKAVAVTPPDQYLTVGDAGELLGADDPSIPFKGYTLGTPPSAGPRAGGQQALP